MWETLLLINSVLLSLAATFLVYSIGAMILLGAVKVFAMALFIFIFLGLAEIALGALSS